MGEEFDAKYVVIWGDGKVRGFDRYSDLSNHLKDCLTDEYCKTLKYRVFEVANNQIKELYL